MGRGGTSRTSLEGEPENNRIIANKCCCSRRPSLGWEWCGGARPAVALSEFEAPAAGSLSGQRLWPRLGACVCGGGWGWGVCVGEASAGVSRAHGLRT